MRAFLGLSLLLHLHTPYRARLEAPKYIVNASGDDFFVPDGSHLYYGRLPGIKSLRMVPDSSHYDASTPVEWSESSTARIAVQTPASGWRAYFVEATYADGYVATSQTYILGEQEYPDQAPPADQDRCTTLAGRGLRP